MNSRILIVGQPTEIRETLRNALQAPEWELREEPDAQAALDLVHEYSPQVILAAVDMLDVTSFLEQLRSTREAPVVVLITPPGSRERAIQELRAGAHDYILMPLAPEELRYRVSCAVERKRTLDAILLQLTQAEKMASLGRLVAGVAHELNTPIAAIYSNSDVLSRSVRRLMGLVSDLPPSAEKREIQAVLEVLSNTSEVDCIACERVIDVVRNLKTFARLDEAERKAVDIHEGLDSTLRLVECQFKSNVHVSKDYGELPPIECYPNQLNEVFMNLLVNASEAIEGQGIIKIRTRREGDSVVITIADTGKGILAADLAKIFDPGFTTKGPGVGTGLGLSIVYKIIQAHGGTIEADSTMGKGTTFTITLPLAASQRATSVPVPEPQPHGG